MEQLIQSIVTSLDGDTTELYPFLPYILQDLWEIGSDPELITFIVEKHIGPDENLKVLDLGCGKGAVSIKLAKKFNCKCHGIDAMPEFISEARQKAIEYKVEHLCCFEVADIRERIYSLQNFDVIILGSIGPVLGNYYSTLMTLKQCLSQEGVIIMDDGYIENESDFKHPIIQSQNEVFSQIEKSGMFLIDEIKNETESIKESDDFIFNKIQQRCDELILKYPEKRNIFEAYLRKQEEENDILENKITCSAMVIGPKPK